MKQASVSLLFLLGTLLVAGCSQNTEGDGVSPSGEESGKVYLDLQVQNELQSRAALHSSGHIQMVTDVQLYIFDTETNLCVASENVDWDANNAGKENPSKGYVVQYKFENPAHNYLLLAVGLDAESKTAYGLPEAINVDTPLSDALASIENTTDQVADYTAIDNAPIFSGQATVTGEGGRVSITLNRRVAGILCYLKNIPTYIQGDVTKIQLRLNTKRNTTVTLAGAATGSKPTEASESSEILYELEPGLAFPSSGDGPYYTHEGGTQDEEDKIYAGLDLGITVVANSIFKGLFMFPVIADATNSQATLSIVALDKDNNELKTWILQNGDGNRYYSIEANCLYSIGSKPTVDNNDNSDAPLDLMIKDEDIILIPDYEVVYRISDVNATGAEADLSLDTYINLNKK